MQVITLVKILEENDWTEPGDNGDPVRRGASCHSGN